MKTELEEAAENYNDKFQENAGSKPPHIKNKHIMNHFMEGAKWQAERSYNEEEAGELVYTIIGQYARHYGIMIDGAKINELFEQFKKK